MKPIILKDKLPKFLVVNEEPQKRSYNKFLIHPFVCGEIVKVAPFDEQIRNKRYDSEFIFCNHENNPVKFRMRFVVIYRKDSNGKFTLKYTESWKSFKLLTKMK